MQPEICCMTITDMAATRYALPTPHIYVTLVWPSYTTRISATAGFPAFVSLPFQYNSVLQAYLPLNYEIQIPFTIVSTTPPASPAFYFLFIRRSSFSHIVTTAKWKI